MNDFKLDEGITTKIVKRDDGKLAKVFQFYSQAMQGWDLESCEINKNGQITIVITK